MELPIKGDLSLDRMLGFARGLQRAKTFTELLEAARDEVRDATGYGHAWLMVQDAEVLTRLRLIEISGATRDNVWEVAPVLDVTGDTFLEAILASNVPVVVEDARTDARTNKEIVAQLQNRTLINIPLMLIDAPFGVFGVGTFGDEGCRAPTQAELQYLVGMANQISVAASRIRYLEDRARAEKERFDLERRLAQMQRLDSLGTLAGGIAHDFNNLLTVITASASLAEPLIENEQARDDVRAVLQASARATELTRQLLAMSRSQPLSLGPIEMNGLLARLLELVRRILPATIAVELIEGRGLPLTEGDSSQIEQVFMNLFINARDAMAGGGRLTIETEHVLVNGQYVASHPWANPGRYVLITVTDSGIGMEREVLERIFEPFFTTKGPHAGTGLGLAVAYGIVQQHRGMLHCYSELNLGTSFKVYLPAAEQRAAAVGTKLQPRIVMGEGYVLVVEDAPAVRQLAVRVLERGGYRVKAVGDGSTACQAVAAEAFDLVLLDVVMPGMPCSQAIKLIREARPGTPILLSSGYTAGESVTKLMAETGLGMLPKPYDPDQMLRTVRQVMMGNASRSGDDSK